MNLATLNAIAVAFSFKREIKYILVTFAVICLIPVMAVVLLAQVGLNLISGSLASRDTHTANVAIHNPRTGEIVDYVTEPVVWPALGPVSLEFAQSDLPYQPFHTGIDIADPNREVGQPITAFMKGTVIDVKTITWGFGKHVKIDHSHHVTAIYAHLDSINVTVGQEVEVGDIIGTMGSTGWSTGPHIHFQTNIYGIPVNPRIFLLGEPSDD